MRHLLVVEGVQWVHIVCGRWTESVCCLQRDIVVHPFDWSWSHHWASQLCSSELVSAVFIGPHIAQSELRCLSIILVVPPRRLNLSGGCWGFRFGWYGTDSNGLRAHRTLWCHAWAEDPPGNTQGQGYFKGNSYVSGEIFTKWKSRKGWENSRTHLSLSHGSHPNAGDRLQQHRVMPTAVRTAPRQSTVSVAIPPTVSMIHIGWVGDTRVTKKSAKSGDCNSLDGVPGRRNIMKPVPSTTKLQVSHQKYQSWVSLVNHFVQQTFSFQSNAPHHMHPDPPEHMLWLWCWKTEDIVKM